MSKYQVICDICGKKHIANTTTELDKLIFRCICGTRCCTTHEHEGFASCPKCKETKMEELLYAGGG